VVDGWDADGRGVELEFCSEEFGDGGEGRNVVGVGESDTTCSIGLDDGGEMNELGVSLFELAVDADMISSESASANDSYL
jgi:hypothetical protein